MPLRSTVSAIRRKLNKAAREATLRAIVGRSNTRMERLGTDYGGWWVPVDGVDAGSVCYSFGLGEDGSFDLALVSRFGAEVWSFDPTPRAIEYARTIDTPGFHFRSVGVWNEDKDVRFYEPQNEAHVSHSITNEQRTSNFFVAHCQTVRSIAEELDHEVVDLIKMDIEGAEAVVVEDLVEHGPHPRILMIECDHFESPRRMLRRMKSLRRVGYVPVKSEGLTLTLVLVGSSS